MRRLTITTLALATLATTATACGNYSNLDLVFLAAVLKKQ